MVGFDKGCRAEGIAPRRLRATASAIRKGNARQTMNSKFGFKKTEAAEEATSTANAEPQAYVFLGRDKYRADEQPTGAQGWRELFLTLSRMAAKGTNGKVTQNTFGLEILYTGLLEILDAAKQELGSDFDAEYTKTLNAILEEEDNKAERKAARAKADRDAEAKRNPSTEDAPEETPEETPEEKPEEQPAEQPAATATPTPTVRRRRS
jgi:hypothetical protein